MELGLLCRKLTALSMVWSASKFLIYVRGDLLSKTFDFEAA